jgi:hypothetical protein
MKKTSVKSKTKKITTKPVAKSVKKTTTRTVSTKQTKKITKKPTTKKAIIKKMVKMPTLTDHLISISVERTDGCEHDAAWNLFQAATTLLHYADSDDELFNDMIETARDVFNELQSHGTHDGCGECVETTRKTEAIDAPAATTTTIAVSSPTTSDTMCITKLN